DPGARRRRAPLRRRERRLLPHLRRDGERRGVLLGRQSKWTARRRDHGPANDAGAREGRAYLHHDQRRACTHVRRDVKRRRGVPVRGAAYCWGENLDGELGHGTSFSQGSPVPVAGGLGFAAVRAGWYHVCGRMKTGAGTYCWGYNAHGQLGEGTTVSGLTPVPVVQ